MKRAVAVFGLTLIALLTMGQVVRVINRVNDIPEVRQWTKSNADIMAWNAAVGRWTNAAPAYTWTNLATNIFSDQFTTNGANVSLAVAGVSTNWEMRGEPIITNFSSALHYHTNDESGGTLGGFQPADAALTNLVESTPPARR